MTAATPPAGAHSAIAADVRTGLLAARKSLPPRLFYDERGSALFEQITELPEYYLTRTERAILEREAGPIVRLAAGQPRRPLQVLELGAGSAVKSQILLAALVREQGRTVFVPVDISASAQRECAERLGRELPEVEVRPVVGRHEDALAAIRGLAPRRLLLFLGSSVGNLSDAEAVALLTAVRGHLTPGDTFLLGADRCRDPAILLPAYDDSQGVTAAFNLNVLVRINRELGGHFDPDRFAHRAIWNEAGSAIEMHLESLVEQRVAIDALGLQVPFRAGETIHTETSAKYADDRVERIVGAAGFLRERTFSDDQGRFGLHLCRAA